MNLIKIDYRPEIDGLRAIAVFSVIIYHAKIFIFGKEFLAGGYLGVDIFFVISGYLITSIIYKEVYQTKDFSFIYFYKRRIRRILPVLFFVISISLPFAYLSLLPNSLIDFTKSIIYTLGFSSNFYFYFSGQEYSAIDSIFNPFLHTWSLSIEEQFYLIFPIFFVLIFFKFQNKLILLISITFLISFFLSIFQTEINASKSFYFIHSRFWELLSGSLIACFEFRGYFNKLSKNLSNFLVNLSFFVIIFSFLFFNQETKHPSYFTLLPIIACCLILLFINKDQKISKILSSKVLVFLGLTSYSLYLWHYPIFAFYRVYFSGSAFISFFFDKVFIILILFSFSILSYFFIERYFRNKKISFKRVIIFLIINILFIISFSITSLSKKGFEDRIPKEIQNKLSIINFYTKEYRSCFVKFNFKINKFCKFGNFQKDVVLLGDSRSAFLINDLKEKLFKNKYNMNIITMGKIQFVDNTAQVKYMLNESLKFKDSILIINGVYNDPNKIFEFSKEKENFLNYFEKLNNNNNKIIFLRPIPVIENPYNFSQGNMRLVNMIKERKILEFKENKKIHELNSREYISFKNFIKSRINNVHFIDLDPIFCDKLNCYSIKNGYLLLQDRFHQSGYTSGLINDMIINKINDIKMMSK